MEIFITNDDGYSSKGIRILAGIMENFGNVTVIAPKEHQSGMSMALTMGGKEIEYRRLPSHPDGEKSDRCSWAWFDATPASCTKFALNTIFRDKRMDVIVTGINHGSNASTAASYSGTLGAAQEGTLNGVPSIAVSMDTNDPQADFSAVEKFFPRIFSLLYARLRDDEKLRCNITYNVNFPCLPADQVRGISFARMGHGHWEREFRCTGEDRYVMVGNFVDEEPDNGEADHVLLCEGWITIVPHSLYTTDENEYHELCKIEFE